MVSICYGIVPGLKNQPSYKVKTKQIFERTQIPLIVYSGNRVSAGSLIGRGCRIIPDSARNRSMNYLNLISVQIVSIQISVPYTSCSLIGPSAHPQQHNMSSVVIRSVVISS